MQTNRVLNGSSSPVLFRFMVKGVVNNAVDYEKVVHDGIEIARRWGIKVVFYNEMRSSPTYGHSMFIDKLKSAAQMAGVISMIVTGINGSIDCPCGRGMNSMRTHEVHIWYDHALCKRYDTYQIAFETYAKDDMVTQEEIDLEFQGLDLSEK